MQAIRKITGSGARWAGGLTALALVVSACSGAEPGTSGDGTIETRIERERFTSLEVSSDHLTGVFVKGDRALAFAVDRRTGGSSFTLSTESGQTLYAVSASATGSETRIGSSYQSVLPRSASQSPPSPLDRTDTPADFQSSGDLKAAYDGLEGTEIELLPYLAAALGRIGLDGARAPIALPVHMTALHLTNVLGLTLDDDTVEATRQIMAASPKDTSPGSNLEGFSTPTTITCPSGKPPCPAGMIAATTGLLAGCCITPPPPAPADTPDYSKTASCSSGAAREVFSNMTQNPCRDDCLGLCGPGCKPWDWICGDERVHAACWNHDSAYCPDHFTVWGVDIPNPEYALCEAEYGLYSVEIGADTILGPLCVNNTATDLLTRPWPGLWSHVPGYYSVYQNAPAATIQSPPAQNYYSSSVLPGYDSYPHGPAQVGDHKRLPASWLPWTAAMDGNFYDGATFHSDYGWGQWVMVDLGAAKNITRIMLYNRTDYWNYPNDRLTNFAVSVWDAINYRWIQIADDKSFMAAPAGTGIEYPLGADGSIQDFNPQGGTNSQYVLIQKTDWDYLVLADVDIWAY